jgi:hypothetical protein
MRAKRRFVMKRFASYLPFVVVLSLILLALPALAQNETTMKVDVKNPVAVPGRILAPGHYVFHLVDVGSLPKEVQILKADGTPVVGFIPVYESIREHHGNTTVKTSKPDHAGVVRITSWYFPGERYGYRFDYSKSQKRKLDMIARGMHTQTAAGM